MAFTVEDGTGVTGANSYAAVATADTYASDRVDSTWGATTTDEKQEALIKATDYLETHYRWIEGGSVLSSTQGLRWPIADFYNVYGILVDGVPDQVEEAVCYLAGLIVGGSTLGSKLGKSVKMQEVTGAVKVEYFPGMTDADRYPYVDGLLSGLTAGGASVGVNLL